MADPHPLQRIARGRDELLGHVSDEPIQVASLDRARGRPCLSLDERLRL
jgi:hypothetical protein